LRPNHHYQSIVEMAGRDETGFAVIEPVVEDCRSAAVKHFARTRKI
jgi:hypothetical protein